MLPPYQFDLISEQRWIYLADLDRLELAHWHEVSPHAEVPLPAGGGDFITERNVAENEELQSLQPLGVHPVCQDDLLLLCHMQGAVHHDAHCVLRRHWQRLHASVHIVQLIAQPFQVRLERIGDQRINGVEPGLFLQLGIMSMKDQDPPWH